MLTFGKVLANRIWAGEEELNQIPTKVTPEHLCRLLGVVWYACRWWDLDIVCAFIAIEGSSRV